jgi:hypothetical protein
MPRLTRELLSALAKGYLAKAKRLGWQIGAEFTGSDVTQHCNRT